MKKLIGRGRGFVFNEPFFNIDAEAQEVLFRLVGERDGVNVEAVVQEDAERGLWWRVAPQAW